MKKLLRLLHILVPGLAFVVLLLSPTQVGVKLFGRLSLSVVDPLVFMAFGLWMAHMFLLRPCRRMPRPPLLAVLFALVAGLSMIPAVNRLLAIGDIIQWLEYFVLAYLLFRGVLTCRERLRWMALAFAGVATVVVGVAVFQYLNPAVSSFQVRAAFGNRNVLGGYLSLAVPLLAGMALGESNGWRRAWFLVAATAGLAVNLSGGSMIAIVMALGSMAAVRGSRMFLVVAIGLLLGAAGMAPLLPRENGRILAESVQLHDEANQVSPRYTEWQAAVNMCSQNPWLGVGQGNYQLNIGSYYGTLPAPTGPKEADTQNLFLVTASSTGLPGLACLIGLLLGFMYKALRAHLAPVGRMEKGLALGVFGGLMAFGINAMWSPLVVRGIGISLAALLAFAGAMKALSASGDCSEDPPAEV